MQVRVDPKPVPQQNCWGTAVPRIRTPSVSTGSWFCGPAGGSLSHMALQGPFSPLCKAPLTRDRDLLSMLRCQDWRTSLCLFAPPQPILKSHSHCSRRVFNRREADSDLEATGQSWDEKGCLSNFSGEGDHLQMTAVSG